MSVCRTENPLVCVRGCVACLCVWVCVWVFMYLVPLGQRTPEREPGILWNISLSPSLPTSLALHGGDQINALARPGRANVVELLGRLGGGRVTHLPSSSLPRVKGLSTSRPGRKARRQGDGRVNECVS